MGFFGTIAQGYKIMFSEAKLGWQNHGAQFLTGTGTGLMMIANGLFARKAMKDEVKNELAEVNKLIKEIKETPIVSETKTEIIKENSGKQYKLAKARAKKLGTIGKHFWKEAAVSAAGAISIGAGQHMNTVQKTMLATGLTAVSAEFAAYRANVIADQGSEKDLQYMTTKQIKAQGNIKVAESADGENTYFTTDETGVTVKADPNAFKFWFSPETCPSLYTDNLDLTKSNLVWVEDTLTRMGRMNGHVYLNDMRREFGGLTPNKMDHPLGGIFGKIFDRNKVDGCQRIDLGWRADQDFCEGRKIGVWIIFPCDPEPIVGKVNQKILAVEDPVR